MRPLFEARPRLAEQSVPSYTESVNFEEYITPDVRSGKPYIKRTRITVYDILEDLAGGMTEAELLLTLPNLNRTRLPSTIGVATDSLSSRSGRASARVALCSAGRSRKRRNRLSGGPAAKQLVHLSSGGGGPLNLDV